MIVDYKLCTVHTWSMIPPIITQIPPRNVLRGIKFNRREKKILRETVV